MLNRFAPVALLLLAACGPTPAGPRPLEGARIGGAFTLTNQDGERVTDKSLAGKWALVYFGYTYCPDICPTDVQRTAQGLKQFRAAHPDLAGKVQQIFISVDPARDTPAVVGEFVAAFDRGIVGLTGTPEQVKAAADAFKVFYSKGKDEGGGAYLVDHSTITSLFDPAGRPVATLPTDQGAPAVAQELAKWVH